MKSNFKRDIKDAIRLNLVEKTLKRYKKQLKNSGWTVSEHVQAVFPKIYKFVLKEFKDDKDDKDNKDQTKLIEIIKLFLKYKIRIDKKQFKSVKDEQVKKIISDSNLFIKSSISISADQFGFRKVKVGSPVLMHLRDLSGTVYLDQNNNTVYTVGVLINILSKDKVQVKDSFGNTYVVFTNELKAVLIDVHGHQYYSDMTVNAQSLIVGNLPNYSSNSMNRRFKVGDYVVIRLRRRDSSIIQRDNQYVPVIAKITQFNGPHSVYVIDAVGNVHQNVSESELEPVLLDVNNQQFYTDMNERAVNIYSKL